MADVIDTLLKGPEYYATYYSWDYPASGGFHFRYQLGNIRKVRNLSEGSSLLHAAGSGGVDYHAVQCVAVAVRPSSAVLCVIRLFGKSGPVGG